MQLLKPSSKPLRPSEGVQTELCLTAFRACWLWNAAGIDLNQLKTKLFQIRAFV